VFFVFNLRHRKPIISIIISIGSILLDPTNTDKELEAFTSGDLRAKHVKLRII